MENALEKAVELLGSQAELARKIGKKQAHVWNWLHRDRRVPADMAMKIETATDGRVTRHDLRPDLYPDPHSDSGSRRQTDPHPEAG